jgi:hypothetical protein
MKANQLYKQYRATGGTLCFKEWANQILPPQNYNATGSAFATTKPITDSLLLERDKLLRAAGYKDALSDEYILGMPKNVVLIAGIAVAATVLGFIIYKKSN